MRVLLVSASKSLVGSLVHLLIQSEGILWRAIYLAWLGMGRLCAMPHMYLLKDACPHAIVVWIRTQYSETILAQGAD